MADRYSVEDSTPPDRCCCWVGRDDETPDPTCTLCLGSGISRLRDRNTPSVFLANLHYHFAQTDGTYKYPPSAVGDLLRQAKTEIEKHLGISK